MAIMPAAPKISTHFESASLVSQSCQTLKLDMYAITKVKLVVEVLMLAEGLWLTCSSIGQGLRLVYGGYRSGER